MTAPYLALEDLTRLAGFHTGQYSLVLTDYLARPAVRLHEGVHDRIFRETSDGLLHLVVLGLIGRQKTHPKLDPLKKVSDFLFQDTRVAHERAATYIGIKSLNDRAERAREVDALPHAYLEYYEFFAAWIDPFVESTYVQCCFAWAVSSWAFCSERAAASEEDSWPDLGDLAAYEGPTERLRLFADVISRNPGACIDGVLREAQESLAREGIRWTDIRAEAAWLEEPGVSNGTRTQHAITDAMTRYLERTTQRPRARPSDVAGSRFVQLADQAGISLNSRNEPSSVENLEAILQAEQADAARVLNPRAAVAWRYDPVGALRFANQRRFQDVHVCAVADPRSPSTHYIVYPEWRQRDGAFRAPSTSALHMSGAELRKFTRQLYQRSAHSAAATVVVEQKDWGTCDLRAFEGKGRAYARLPTFALPRRSRELLFFPYLYVGHGWSVILRQVPGRLALARVTIPNELSGAMESFLVSVLYPDDEDGLPVPYMNISSISQGMASHASLVAWLEKQGSLKLLKNVGTSQSFELMVRSVMSTLPMY